MEAAFICLTKQFVLAHMMLFANQNASFTSGLVNIGIRVHGVSSLPEVTAALEEATLRAAKSFVPLQVHFLAMPFVAFIISRIRSGDTNEILSSETICYFKLPEGSSS